MEGIGLVGLACEHRIQIPLRADVLDDVLQRVSVLKSDRLLAERTVRGGWCEEHLVLAHAG